MRRFFAAFIEIGEIALVAIGAVFLIRNFLVQPFLVSGESMVPNFQNGDYLLIDELTYRLRTPVRGEVDVFRYPNDETTYFIKRVIGLPGERILIRDGRVTIFNDEHKDGFTLNELSYLPAGLSTEGNADVTLQDNQYFMLGDNRPYSSDSRTWGVLPAKDIIGLVRMRLWPLNAITVFAAPQY
ncbi:MAG: signal peptidase I [bacterium]|nr:signal peptidase I [bacterium]